MVLFRLVYQLKEKILERTELKALASIGDKDLELRERNPVWGKNQPQRRGRDSSPQVQFQPPLLHTVVWVGRPVGGALSIDEVAGVSRVAPHLANTALLRTAAALVRELGCVQRRVDLFADSAHLDPAVGGHPGNAGGDVPSLPLRGCVPTQLRSSGISRPEDASHPGVEAEHE